MTWTLGPQLPSRDFLPCPAPRPQRLRPAPQKEKKRAAGLLLPILALFSCCLGCPGVTHWLGCFPWMSLHPGRGPEAAGRGRAVGLLQMEDRVSRQKAQVWGLH